MSEKAPLSDPIPLQRKMQIVDVEEPTDIISDHLTRDDQIGLGRSAILNDMWRAQTTIRKNKDPNIFQRIDNLDIEFEIGKVRKALGKLEPELLKPIIDQMEGTFIGRQLIGEDTDDSTIEQVRARLTAKEKGRHIVSDATMLNFLQWYMGQTLEKQKGLDAEVASLKVQYKDRIRSAVDAGWIPGRVVGNLPLIDAVDVLYDDMFHTIAEDRTGYYDPSRFHLAGSPTIALAPSLKDEPARQDEVLTHEFNHALSNDNNEKYSRRYLLKEVFGKHGALVLEEAMTEHLAQSLVHGDLHTVRSSMRQTRTGSYELYRAFFGAMTDFGVDRIDVRTFYDSLYFARQDKHLTENEGAQNLLRRITRVFPTIDIVAELRSVKNDDQLEVLLGKMSKFHQGQRAEDEEFITETLRRLVEKEALEQDTVKVNKKDS